MPRVPVASRNPVSSLVGTPGIDRSAGAIASTISSVASTAQKVNFDIGLKRKQARDATEAQKAMIELGGDLENADSQFKKDNPNNYRDQKEAYSELLMSVVENKINSIPSEDVKSSVSRMALNDVNRFVLNFEKAASEQELVAAQGNIVAGQRTLANRASNAQSYNDVRPLLDEFDNLLAASSFVLSPKQLSALEQDGRKGIISGHILGKLQNNPAQLRSELDSGVYDQFLSPEEKLKYKDDAYKRFGAMEKQAKINRLQSQVETHSDIWDKYMSGNLTLADIGQLDETNASPEFVDFLRSSYFEQNPVSQDDKDRALIDITDRYQVIDKSISDGDIKLEDLLRFQNEAMKAVGEGRLTRSDANKYLKRNGLVSSFVDELRNERGNIDANEQGFLKRNFSILRNKEALDSGYQVIQDYINKNYDGEALSQKAAMYRDLVSRIDREGVSSITDEKINDIAKQVVASQMYKDHPETRTLNDIPNSILRDGKITQVASGKRNIKTNGSVSVPFQEFVDKNGNRARRYADGRIEEVK